MGSFHCTDKPSFVLVISSWTVAVVPSGCWNSAAVSSCAYIFMWMYVFLALVLSLGVLEKNLIPFICELCERAHGGPSSEMGRTACCTGLLASCQEFGGCASYCMRGSLTPETKRKGVGFQAGSASLSWAELSSWASPLSSTGLCYLHRLSLCPR